ncbi:hypothetical protein DL764_005061 [Monosporascus ibericus]|uniref:3'-5' exonuclease domain-containing protein n=1 Tax=Monosporascus ibericus TaxID=155417 RepID=A0A4Q4TDK9_9PEZI|nr:hypothetical protein DL764_005061 [Monosporascus ibericus]
MEMISVPSSDLVDTCEALSTMIDALQGLPSNPPSLYIDLEGESLSRHGSISLLQIYASPRDHTYLVDIRALGARAFSVPGAGGCTLKQMLESASIPKVFFDVRNDSDALYAHYGIDLSGVQDLQLMELATRTSADRRRVNGLSKCIERDAPLAAAERLAWEAAKKKGVRLFAPEHGGSYRVFDERPLSEDIRLYCVQDVRFLPRLWSRYDTRLTPLWRQRVRNAVAERVALSQSPGFNGKGKHMALAPRSWS